MDNCVRNLQAEHIIAASSQPLPATMSLFLKPKDEHSARVICDLRPLNGLYTTDPPSFSLPSVSALVSTTRWWPSCFFTKLDINAYFHSLALQPTDLRRLCPPDMPTHPFVFHYRDQCWMWMRLPFGWSWAPALAQKQMQELVNAAVLAFPEVLGLVYYDDILMASRNDGLLEMATAYLVDYLHQQGLHISQHKCVLTPVPFQQSTESTNVWVTARWQQTGTDGKSRASLLHLRGGDLSVFLDGCLDMYPDFLLTFQVPIVL